MAVSIPSDLILDVMRNADPARLNVAKAKLHSLDDREGSPVDFASVLGGIDRNVAQGGPAAVVNNQGKPPELPSGGVQTAAMTDAHVDFERMVLRNLFESLLPPEGSGAFGSGPSAGVWRSLAADQLAGVYAGEGGIGIASSLTAHQQSAGAAGREWPYFSTGKIEAFTG
jgi:peptidoglycan hydrolase FlgJ